MTEAVPYGHWPSPLTPERMAGQAGVTPSRPWWVNGRPAWLETRPEENGRVVPVARDADGVRPLLEGDFSVRSRVYEYGGGAWWPEEGGFAFVNDLDGGLYRLREGDVPRRIAGQEGVRWADGDPIPGGTSRVCVRETATDDPTWPRHEIVRVDDDGTVDVLVGGADYVAAPRVSPDGRWLAWLEWRFPATPWLESRLMVAELEGRGLGEPRCLEGGERVSVLNPRWLDEETLLALSDREGYWTPSLARPGEAGDAGLRPVLDPAGCEWGRAPWVLGGSPQMPRGEGAVAIRFREGLAEMVSWRLDGEGGAVADPLALPFTDLEDVAVAPGSGQVLCLAAGPVQARSVVLIDPESGAWENLSGAPEEILGALGLREADVAHPEPVTFTGWEGRSAHAFLYRPRLSGCSGPPATLPPMIVRAHGGPTAMRTAAFDPVVQFWTTRGYAVLEVNYSGSAGYGRAYRERLHEAWGVADRDDVCAAAEAAAARGWAERGRILITGNSAGGYTALSAIVGESPFAGAMSRYGVSELERLRECTHKLEAGYLDWLIGPWPDARDRFWARSPLYGAERIHRPVLFLQGAEDRVVPPEQTASMHQALKDNGVPVRMREFAGEGHGFRTAETVAEAFREEEAFAAAVIDGRPIPPER